MMESDEESEFRRRDKFRSERGSGPPPRDPGEGGPPMVRGHWRGPPRGHIRGPPPHIAHHGGEPPWRRGPPPDRYYGPPPVKVRPDNHVSGHVQCVIILEVEGRNGYV